MADASHASYLPPILSFCAGAVIAVPLFRRLGLSAELGYLAAGVVIGPEAPGIVRDADTIRGVAEIGVVLLLFLVGLELQPSRLLSMRRDIFGAGLAQMALTAALFALAGWLMGLSVAGAVVAGTALALSATAIALQLLEERGDGTRRDVLRAVGAGRARVVAVFIDDQKAALRIAELVKSEFPQARIIARPYDRRHAIELRKAGVDRYVRETFESALYFGRVTLEKMGFSVDEAAEISADMRRRDLKRLEAQTRGDIMSGKELLHTSANHGVMPEPLSRPRKAGEALSEDTRAVVAAHADKDTGQLALHPESAVATGRDSR
jgi:voltage-gated potassium channel Kch